MPINHESSRLEAAFVGVLFAVLGVGVIALGGREWLPALASRHGAGVDRMLGYLLLTTGGLLLVGHIVLAVFILRYAGRPKVTHRLASPKAERGWSIALGLLMTIIAEGGVLAIGLPVFEEYFGTEPPEDAIIVEVTGEQFVWNVRYAGRDGVFGRTRPEPISTTNPLGIDPDDPAGIDDRFEINNIYLEVDRAAKVVLRSKDVLHSFFLPHLRVKQDAVPGMTIPIWFVPTAEGRFDIACAELCGLAHYRMQGFVHVMSKQAFTDWRADGEIAAAAAAGR